MAVLLMKTGGASAEEVDGMIVRLDEAGIANYTTEAGRWRLGVDGLWLVHKEELDEATSLLAAYQREFSRDSRECYRAMAARGETGFGHQLKRHPLKVCLGLVGVAAILALSILPFIRGL
ncbi:DUF6164 family protein [Gilvimarinus algae]|uniref:DUF6164 family protein n=1 Tax=Gilvimarinus algae TaxID=3058037 RepID=A0ABT8TEM6_9GAMM|nr:DUF6164 family protein [Gilvimarinus sp. SDUM040014]MDO3381984.1 DUF6164 family protein [Gilvimarinus sp. SDUM040014]